MKKICPLIFEPIYVPKIWGGRNLERLYGRTLPDTAIGESWEVADLENGQSIVRSGPGVEGKTLSQLVHEWGTDLLGNAPLFEGRFPLLIKYLDACENLSVQVHPDKAMADRLGGSVRVKNEAWYILDSQPEGAIYRGLTPGVDKEAFIQSVENGTSASTLNRIDVNTGECYYLPSGTVHALGKGIVVAEIQTPSDTTFRVYDWDRVDASTGQPREMHIDQALECIAFGERIYPEENPANPEGGVNTIVQCDSFRVKKVEISPSGRHLSPNSEISVWMVLHGKGQIEYGTGNPAMVLNAGDTAVLPAALGQTTFLPSEPCTILEVTMPETSQG